MKYMFEKYKDNSEELYKQLDDVNQKHRNYEFDYFKSIVDFKCIGSSFSLDLDLLSDSMAVCNCYVLSRSTNLSQEIRDDLNLYFRCSLIVLLISVLPKINCYIFLILRFIVSKMVIIEKQ